MILSKRESKTQKNAVRLLVAAAVIGAGYLVLARADLVLDGVKSGTAICLESVVPSLFIFMIFAEFISSTDLSSVMFFPFRLLAKLFRVSGESAPVLAVSMLGGYPAGAKMIANLVKRGRLSVATAEKLLCSCVNCSPSFLIGAVGVSIFHSVALGGILYACQMAAMLVTGILAGFLLKSGKEGDYEEQPEQDCNYLQSFVSAVTEAGKSMFLICCFVVVFAVALIFIKDVAIGSVLGGLLEVSVGCASLAGKSFREALILSTVYTSLGGVCVWMQVACFLRKTGVQLKKFLLFRCCYSFFSLGFTLLAVRYMEISVQTFSTAGTVVARNGSVSVTAACFLVGLCLLLVMGQVKGKERRKKA